MPLGKGASNERYTGGMSEEDPTKKKDNVVPSSIFEARRNAQKIKKHLQGDPNAHLLSSDENRETIDNETKELMAQRNRDVVTAATNILSDFPEVEDVAVLEDSRDRAGLLDEYELAYAILRYTVDKDGFMRAYSTAYARALAERGLMLFSPNP